MISVSRCRPLPWSLSCVGIVNPGRVLLGLLGPTSSVSTNFIKLPSFRGLVSMTLNQYPPPPLGFDWFLLLLVGYWLNELCNQSIAFFGFFFHRFLTRMNNSTGWLNALWPTFKKVILPRFLKVSNDFPIQSTFEAAHQCQNDLRRILFKAKYFPLIRNEPHISFNLLDKSKSKV